MDELAWVLKTYWGIYKAQAQDFWCSCTWMVVYRVMDLALLPVDPCNTADNSDRKYVIATPSSGVKWDSLVPVTSGNS